MSEGYATKRNFALLRELSAADAQLAERAMDKDEKRRRKVDDTRAKALETAHEDAHRRLRDLVGKKDWASLRKAMREQRLEVRHLLQPPKGIGRDPAQLNTARKRKADALLRKLGVNRQKLIGIGSAFQKQVEKISAPVSGTIVPGYYTPNNIAKWMNLSPLNQAPLPWGVAPPVDDPNDPHRWFLFQPPFFSFPDSFVPVEGGISVSATHSSTPFAGYVGHDVSMRLGDADSLDVASADVDTRIGFIFEAVTNGPLEIIIDAQNASGTHYLKTRDEFGWSSTWTLQANYLTAQVLHPLVGDRLLAEMSSLDNKNIDTTEHQALITGHHYFLHATTTGPVEAGQSVAILVGTHNWEKCVCNDVGYESDTSFHWTINSVQVRTRD